MNYVYNVIAMLGGLAMFLYGMRIMGDGLKSSSGGALKAVLGKLTHNTVMAFILGMLVTCMIQSSTASIVLTVGLVGAGVLSFRQSVGIVLGANVGTAITAQIIRLMDVDASSGSILYFFKADNLAPMALIIGIILIMFVNRRAAKNTGSILMGFGILFMGLIYMSEAVSSMGDVLSRFLTAFEDNYLLGFLAGTAVTGIIQSSSAVIGILQSIASSVGVRFCGVFAVIIGVNIGDCLTTFLVCRIGARPDQIRTVLVHVIYNIFAAILIIAVLAIGRGTGLIPDAIWYMQLNSGGVANVHGLFRLVPAVCLLPFSGKFADLAEKIVPDSKIPDEDKASEEALKELDDRLIANPGVALEESAALIENMAGVALHNFHAVRQQVEDYDEKRDERIAQRENLLDRMADAANEFIIKVSPHITTDKDDANQSFQLRELVGYERIGDLAVNIIGNVQNLHEENRKLSDSAVQDLQIALDAVDEVLNLTTKATNESSVALAGQVEPLEEVIDEVIESLQARHVDRMKHGQCEIETGIQYQNILVNLERISDQCSDIAVYLLGKYNPDIAGREHEYIRQLHHAGGDTYQADFTTAYNNYMGRIAAIEEEEERTGKKKKKKKQEKQEKAGKQEKQEKKSESAKAAAGKEAQAAPAAKSEKQEKAQKAPKQEKPQKQEKAKEKDRAKEGEKAGSRARGSDKPKHKKQQAKE